MTETSPAPIVVGVDGSNNCAMALDWAAAEAVQRGCAVEAVSVSTPAHHMTDARSGYSPFADRVAAALTAARAKYPTVQLRHIQIIGSPATALVHAARGASMLVVGSRGAGAVARVLLGSVSTYCSTHAECPVVIVSKDGPMPTPRASIEDGVATPGPLL